MKFWCKNYLNSFFVCVWGVFFRAAQGGPQARGWFKAVAAGLCHSHSHSNIRSKPHLQPTPQLIATLDPNPLSEARDRSYVLLDASQIHLCWATMGTPILTSSDWNPHQNIRKKKRGQKNIYRTCRKSSEPASKIWSLYVSSLGK